MTKVRSGGVFLTRLEQLLAECSDAGPTIATSSKTRLTKRELHLQPFFNSTVSILTSVKMAPKDEVLVDEAPTSINPYEVLGLTKEATADEVKSAYRKAALRHHPGTRGALIDILTD